MAGGAQANKDSGSKGSPPAWLWMIAGLMVGLFVAFLVYLNQHNMPAAKGKGSATAQAKATAKANTTPARAGEKKGMDYDFYSMLPKFELVVPEEEPSPQAPKAPPKPVATPGSYVLQVGSFRQGKDADTLKARLALLGIISTVQTVTIDKQQTWHRVRIGPIADLGRLNQVRSLLRENSIDFMLLRQES